MPKKLLYILGVLIIFAILIAIPAFWLTWGNNNPELEVDFLDVGQGDSELIKTPAGQNILIDGGPNSQVLERLSDCLPWWDRTIDLMILTHPHDDHVTGLVDVLKRYNVKKAVYTGVIHTGPGYIAWLKLIRDNKIPLMIIDRPQTIALGKNLRLDILFPKNSLAGTTSDDLNNTSIVAKLIYGKKSFMFTGDAGVAIEQQLIKDVPDLSADVLKVGHHGSIYSTSDEWLKAVKPKLAVIEVGKDNQFGHPSPRTLKKLERAGAKIYRTDLDGTVKVLCDGENIWLK